MLYFIPGATHIDKTILANAGLADILGPVQYRQTVRGPNGSGGMLVAPTLVVDGKTYLPDYDADRQTWTKRYGGDCWLGRDPDRPERPSNYQRDKQLSGKSVTLRDGNRWTIPQLKVFLQNTGDGPLIYTPRLPRLLRQDPDTGEMIPGDVVPEHSAIWNQAMAISDFLLGVARDTGSATLTSSTAIDFACNLLRCNYRIDKPEIDALGLFDDANYTEVVRIAVDWEGVEAELKNRRSRQPSGGTNSDTGNSIEPTESTDDTTPPSASGSHS